ncbi:MAG: hypothetical protein AAF485_06465 [Chloroflexota bacterium]
MFQSSGRFRLRRTYYILIILVTMACSPLTQLRTLTQSQEQQDLATRTTIINENSNLAIEAYNHLSLLPGYRQEMLITWRDGSGALVNQLVTTRYDTMGQSHTLYQLQEDGYHEFYVIDEQTYTFNPPHQGWVNLGSISPIAAYQQEQNLGPAGLWLTDNPFQLLTQLGVIPTQVGQEIIEGRAVIRYELQPIMAEIAEIVGQTSLTAPTNVNGTLWLDNETQAVIKAEIFVYDQESTQPSQTVSLQIHDIGAIEPIVQPSPIIDINAVVAATSTAEAWVAFPIEIIYKGTPIPFEMVPLNVAVVPNSSPSSLQVYLVLRQIPNDLMTDLHIEPFLAQLRQQLTLSIPEENLIVTSSGFELGQYEAASNTLNVSFFFNAALETQNHIELIVAQAGNPLFVPIPVE